MHRLRKIVQKRVGLSLVCPTENGATEHRTDCERCGICYFQQMPAVPLSLRLKGGTYVTLLSPYFLMHVEQNREVAQAYRVNDWDLANWLSCFLWSSMPDDTLLDLAQQGKLREKKVLDQQVARMLANPKADTLGTVFTSQWLGFEPLAQHHLLDKPNHANGTRDGASRCPRPDLPHRWQFVLKGGMPPGWTKSSRPPR